MLDSDESWSNSNSAATIAPGLDSTELETSICRNCRAFHTGRLNEEMMERLAEVATEDISKIFFPREGKVNFSILILFS